MYGCQRLETGSFFLKIFWGGIVPQVTHMMFVNSKNLISQVEKVTVCRKNNEVIISFGDTAKSG